MKRYISAAFAAVLAVTASGCDNRNEPVTEVSTDDTSAGMVSNYTSQAFQAVSVTTSTALAETTSVETILTMNTTANAGTAVSAETTADSSEPAKTVTVKPSSSKTAASVSNQDTTAAQTQLITTSAENIQQPETTTRSAPEFSDIIAAYKGAVSDKIDAMLECQPGSVYVAYTLFDMDSNGIPELIVKCGTNDEESQDTYYTYDEFGLKVISDGDPGGHSGFAWDPESDKYVLAYSYMGEGMLRWLGYDGSNISELKKTEFEYSGEDTFNEQAKRNGVEWLPFAKYTYSYEELTWVYRVVNGGLEYDEISGRDFSFLDNYEELYA